MGVVCVIPKVWMLKGRVLDLVMPHSGESVTKWNNWGIIQEVPWMKWRLLCWWYLPLTYNGISCSWSVFLLWPVGFGKRIRFPVEFNGTNNKKNEECFCAKEKMRIASGKEFLILVIRQIDSWETWSLHLYHWRWWKMSIKMRF